MQNCRVDILGTEYSVFFVDEFPERLREIGEGSDGLFERYEREIYVLKPLDKELTKKGKERQMKQVLRHELLHCFLEESGISANASVSYCPWPENEEMVDWFAIQSPKIFKTFSELDLL